MLTIIAVALAVAVAALCLTLKLTIWIMFTAMALSFFLQPLIFMALVIAVVFIYRRKSSFNNFKTYSKTYSKTYPLKKEQ